MAKRVGIKPVTRFEVFKRDLFVCQYCGGKPPAVVLEVDHVNPVANGGDNDINNLLTACWDCNRGKAARLLTDLPDTIQKKAELLAEKRLQVKEYEKLLRRERKRIEKIVDRINDVFQSEFNAYLTEPSRASVRRFLSRLTPSVVEDAAITASIKIGNPQDAFKYFCGICWNIIKRDDE